MIETTLGTGPWTAAPPGRVYRALERVLRAVIPAANPDFDDRYCEVKKWWIEVNPAGAPERELGFDDRGAVIVAGPIGDNFGFFTDSNMVFEHGEWPEVDPALFEETWSVFERRWADRQTCTG